MHTKGRLLLTLIIASGAMALLFGFQVSMAATTPGDILAIDLVGFFADSESDDAVVLSWITASEENTAGFVIRRVAGTAPPASFSPFDTIDVIDEEGELVNYIPSDSAETGNLQGATYVVTDTTVTAGESYWYLLVEIEFDGTENEYMDDLVQAWAANATPTPTPITLSTPTPRPSATPLPQSSPTPSPTPSNSPTPTATSSGSGSGNTPTPTATAQATTTPQPTSTVGTGTGGTGGGNNSGPTPTRFTFGTGEDDTTAIAQTDPTVAYPGDGSGSTEGNDPYPAPARETGPDQSAPTAYPENATIQEADPNTGAGGGVNGIGSGAYNGPENSIGNGSGNGTTSDALSDTAQDAQQGSQSVLLWVGFIVALIIFAAGLFGSVLLFTRRRSPSSSS